MADNLNFDANNVAPRTNPPPVPNNWYRAMIVESAVKPTKNSHGKYLQLELADPRRRAQGPHHLGSAQHPEPECGRAEDRAGAALDDLPHAGVLKLGNSAELHNKPALIRVKVVPGQTKEDEPQNEVKGYKPIAAPRPSPPAGRREHARRTDVDGHAGGRSARLGAEEGQLIDRDWQVRLGTRHDPGSGFNTRQSPLLSPRAFRCSISSGLSAPSSDSSHSSPARSSSRS
jgi:hypothetical protein